MRNEYHMDPNTLEKYLTIIVQDSVSKLYMYSAGKIQKTHVISREIT
jgi:hypothetical protein